MPLGSFKSWMIQNYLNQYPGPLDLWALWLPSLSKWTKWLMPNIILKRLRWLIQYPGLEQTHQILHFRKWLTCVRISKWITWLKLVWRISLHICKNYNLTNQNWRLHSVDADTCMTIMYRNDDLSWTMSWVGCLLTD